MTKAINLIAIVVMLLATGCGGGGGGTSGGAASAVGCKDAPTLGQATFGSGCFK